MLKTYEDMLQFVSSKSSKAQLIDARPPNTFHGHFFLPRWEFPFNSFASGANAGHLPRSLNIPYTDVFDQSNQCLKSNDDLQRGKLRPLHEGKNSFFPVVFSNAGVDLSKEGIYTCHTGTTASTLAFAAHLLGQTPLSVYHVSFFSTVQRSMHSSIFASLFCCDDEEKELFHICAKLKLAKSYSQNARTVWREWASQLQQYCFETDPLISLSLSRFRVHSPSGNNERPKSISSVINLLQQQRKRWTNPYLFLSLFHAHLCSSSPTKLRSIVVKIVSSRLSDDFPRPSGTRVIHAVATAHRASVCPSCRRWSFTFRISTGCPQWFVPEIFFFSSEGVALDFGTAKPLDKESISTPIKRDQKRVGVPDEVKGKEMEILWPTESEMQEGELKKPQWERKQINVSLS